MIEWSQLFQLSTASISVIMEPNLHPQKPPKTHETFRNILGKWRWTANNPKFLKKNQKIAREMKTSVQIENFALDFFDCDDFSSIILRSEHFLSQIDEFQAFWSLVNFDKICCFCWWARPRNLNRTFFVFFSKNF